MLYDIKILHKHIYIYACTYMCYKIIIKGRQQSKLNWRDLFNILNRINICNLFSNGAMLIRKF